MSKHIKNAWIFAEGYEPIYQFIDPRLAVVKHTGWTASVKGGKTMHSLPEPDNYNFVIFAEKPHDILDIDYQCWYRDRRRGGWFNMYVIQTVSEANAIHRWLQNNTWIAYWDWPQSPKLRTKMPKIESDNKRMFRKIKTEYTFDEVLYVQGYYDKLIEKGLNEVVLQQYTGSVIGLDIANYEEPELDV